MPEEKNILIMDDNVELVDEIRAGLREHGFCVTTAFDGMTGLKLLKRTDAHLLILDLKMPGLSGLSLFHLIQSTIIPKQIPILVISGEAEMLKQIAEGPVAAVLSKPFSFDVLMEKITGILGEKPGRSLSDYDRLAG